MMKIVSSAKLSEKHQKSLKGLFPDVSFYFFDQIDDALTVLNDTNVLITYGEDLNEEYLSRMGHLRWIHVVSAGLDKMPFSYLQQRGIMVTNSKGIHQVPMSEYTLAVILQIARKTDQFYQNQIGKTWNREIRVSEIHGSTLGIIGLGAIGSAIAEKAKIFGMRVIGINSDGRDMKEIDRVYPPSLLKTVLTESDYIVVIVPLTEQTHHMIGREELLAMKPTAYLINIARGNVVDEQALIEVLKERRIGGVVLDVFSEEPLPEDHPFWNLPNVIITPHVSGRSPKYMERALVIFQYNLEKYRHQEYDTMKNLVNVSKGY
ncbi:D-2-hydroxyacid dehydrogenase [Tepidibacillus marianensis]|uniref:D-2-hydroxyacid dehydrogenase n=1 Tax=Tepidibacillus marianensis TaxID=3131995 RepID=UPI0030D5691D